MTFIVDGNNGATFPDTTIQTTALTTGSVTKAMVSTSTSTGFGLCRAWVNFTGSSAAINGSYNISSVTRASTGHWTINLTTAMANTGYSLCGSAKGTPATTIAIFAEDQDQTRTSSTCYVTTQNSGFTGFDASLVSVAIFSS